MIYSPLKLYINDTNIEGLGGVLVGLEKSPIPEEIVKTYEVPNQSLTLTRRTGVFKPIKKYFTVWYSKSAEPNLKKLIKDARTLRFSDESDLLYDVVRVYGAKAEAIKPNEYLITLEVDCQPFKRIYDEETKKGTELKFKAPYQSAHAEPKIIIRESGTVNVNGQTLTVSNLRGKTILDSALQMVDGTSWDNISTNYLPNTNEGDDLIITSSVEIEVQPQWKVF